MQSEYITSAIIFFKCVAHLIYKFNLYAFIITLPTSMALSLIMQAYPFEDKNEEMHEGRKDYASTDIYQRWNRPTYGNWYSFENVLYRYLVGILGFYINFITKPMNFYYFTIRHLYLRYHTLEVIFFMIFFPILPLKNILGL